MSNPIAARRANASLTLRANAYPEERLAWVHLDGKGVTVTTKPAAES